MDKEEPCGLACMAGGMCLLQTHSRKDMCCGEDKIFVLLHPRAASKFVML
jgi:hypothetical protein